ncbi:hypothetical protein OSB04_un001638 [Centaurea solstitialis]|uniref:SWIM-type domain-containing protein n=1 Tax=Centaurea solstitialis TaxID=347529 RepID=A0AA38VUH9_9ASTR|nr:hypothetical protein OSB04_un001638 [Centaurea solstitialis]
MVKSYLVSVHHDGCFMYQPLRYENGSKVTINVTRMLYEEMVSFLEAETCTIISALYWCIPDNDLESGLCRLANDFDVQSLFDITDSYGHVNIYIDHFGDDLSCYIQNKPDVEGKQGMNEVNEKEEVDVNALDQFSESEDEFDFGFDDEVDEDDSDAKSLDHLSKEDEELVNVRTDKARSKMVPPKKDLPKLGGGIENDTKDDEDLLMGEHDAFMEDLLKALKSGEDVGNEHHAQNEAENVDEGDKYPIHDPSTHWKVKKPMVGERYESPKQFKKCITYYALANGYSIWFDVCSKKKTIARSFKYGSLVNYKWIGKEFGSKIRMNPEMKTNELADLVLKKYKGVISPNQATRAKAWAMNVYEKSLVEHYGMLRAYGDGLLRSNPGSTVNLGVTTNPDDTMYFDRFYVCLSALKEGWKKGCRRIIAIDGCFLKGVCQGELLSAICRDGNNHGLIEAVKEVMPYAEHRQCARHIYENFRKVYSGVEFRNLFWKAAKASYPLEFERVMNEIRMFHKGAHDCLIKREPKTWSRAFFDTYSCCEVVENGFSQCFNDILVKIRSKPIITMLEAIRMILMERMARMRNTCESWSLDICPTVIKKLDNAKISQRYWNVLPGGGTTFEVRQGHDAFIVDEALRTCTCRMWQLSSVPCPHVVAAIFYLHKLPEDYVPYWKEEGGCGQRKEEGGCGQRKAVDKGKKEAVDKGKGKETVDKPTTKGNKKTVGGFMSDARKPFKPPTQQSTQESTQLNEKGRKRKKPQINYGPIRRQAQARITKINLQKQIPGPGSSSTDPHHVERSLSWADFCRFLLGRIVGLSERGQPLTGPIGD